MDLSARRPATALRQSSTGVCKCSWCPASAFLPSITRPVGSQRQHTRRRMRVQCRGCVCETCRIPESAESSPFSPPNACDAGAPFQPGFTDPPTPRNWMPRCCHDGQCVSNPSQACVHQCTTEAWVYEPPNTCHQSIDHQTHGVSAFSIPSFHATVGNNRSMNLVQ